MHNANKPSRESIAESRYRHIPFFAARVVWAIDYSDRCFSLTNERLFLPQENGGSEFVKRSHNFGRPANRSLAWTYWTCCTCRGSTWFTAFLVVVILYYTLKSLGCQSQDVARGQLVTPIECRALYKTMECLTAPWDLQGSGGSRRYSVVLEDSVLL